MRFSPHLRLHNDALSHQAKKDVVPIPKTDARRKKRLAFATGVKSVRTESLRGAKRVEQNSRPSRETRG